MKHETHEPLGSLPQKKKSKTGIVLVLVVLWLIFFVQLGSLYIGKSKQEKEVALLKSRIVSKQATIDQYTNGSSLEVHQSSFEALQTSLSERINWSDANREIQNITKESQSDIIVLDYTSGDTLKFSVNGVGSSMESIAKFIETLEKNPNIQEPFVANIAEQNNTDFDFLGRKPRSVFLFRATFVYSSSSS